jgi:hypothetical protein
VNWESKFSIQLALLGFGAALALPLSFSLMGHNLSINVAGLKSWFENHLFREITGYIGLALALLQNALSIRKRLEWNFPGPSFPAWRGFHILAGVAFLLVVVVHTGGRWGWNLNGWLQSVFVFTVFIGLTGKVWESRLLQRALPVAKPRPATDLPLLVGQAVKPPMPPAGNPGARAAQLRSKVNQARKVWLGAHILLTAAFMALLGFHVFSVYYF